MSGGAGPDHDVREAAAAFGKAVTASLPLVEALAAGPDAEATEPNHPVPTHLIHWPVGPRVTAVPPDLRRRALEEGWLVTTEQPGPVDPSVTGPLAGWHVAVKDLIDVAGLPVRNGTPGGLWRNPSTSAPAWTRLAGAGAHCVGKTAMHEMAWGLTTPTIGNPHDRHRFAGGSSGGSGAVVVAGAAHAALGTDTGGSIRVPAALCGVVGLRPTHGTVDTSDVTPMAPSQDVVGPLAPDLDTCALLLEQLIDRPLLMNPDARARPWRVGVLDSPGALEAEVDAAYRDTLTRLRDRGVEVVHLAHTPLRESGALSVLTMLAESALLHAPAVSADPDGFGGEFRGITSVGEALLAQRSDIEDLLQGARRALRMRTAALFDAHRLDAVLTPTTPCVAPLRSRGVVLLGGRHVPVATALSTFTAWSAASGWPAISVPVPAPDLPVGIQVMALPHREDVCLMLGRWAQRSLSRGELWK